MKYDYLIVGAGLFGVTCARVLTDQGKRCLILEATDHVGGLCYDYEQEGININKYGPHIFHTNSKEIWTFVNRFADFNSYIHRVYSFSNKKLYTMPLNMNVFNQYLGLPWPNDVMKKINEERSQIGITEPRSFEDKCKLEMGSSIYNKFIGPIYNKMFRELPSKLSGHIVDDYELTPSLIYSDMYYSTEEYQGVPIKGYTKLIENMLGDDIDIMFNKDFCSNIQAFTGIAETVIYTGPIDKLCKYVFGPLQYSSVDFIIQDETEHTTNLLGTPVVEFPDPESDWYRMTEFKWFNPERINNFKQNSHTIIGYEISKQWDPSVQPIYNVNTNDSDSLYFKYRAFAEETYPNIKFGGRFGLYSNLSMAKTIEMASILCSSL